MSNIKYQINTNKKEPSHWKFKIGNSKLEIPALQAGFTMIEMLMYMGLLSLLLVVMVNLFASSLDAQLESGATSSVDQDETFILQKLTNDIHKAQSITQPQLGATPSGILQLFIDGITYTYATGSGLLTIASASASNSLNSFNTTTSFASFQRLGNNGGKNAIQIILTIKSSAMRGSGTETRTTQTTVGLR